MDAAGGEPQCDQRVEPERDHGQDNANSNHMNLLRAWAYPYHSLQAKFRLTAAQYLLRLHDVLFGPQALRRRPILSSSKRPANSAFDIATGPYTWAVTGSGGPSDFGVEAAFEDLRR
ncbi:hypothetical protein SLA_2484 [Streptomyces laurentii]|uniref:Uncharacterized protein n=1 Tax=Streptomyces laurentii TaxID=39478 RepID=A0A160NZG4_STRLU|nr:hypothetical protein SLA_2484 [Streptomyces laurentii]